MNDATPILLVPGLGGSPRIYAPVAPALWRLGPVTVANHVRDDNMGAIARRILAEAPRRFALAGHSMAATSLSKSCGRRPIGLPSWR
jgi:pimeloyl-ACP methyl ester carboxylesterase